MILYLLLGIIFIALGFFWEQRTKARRLYKDYLKQFQDESIWQFALEKIVYEKEYNALSSTIKLECQVFLFIKNDDTDICKIDICNKSSENISLLYFNTLLKMFKKEKTVYKFTLQTISIFHHFSNPSNNWILCVQQQSKTQLSIGRRGW